MDVQPRQVPTGQAPALDPVPETPCRIVVKKDGPDGKPYVVLEPITDPDEQRAVRERYRAAVSQVMRTRQEGQRVTQSTSTTGGAS